MSVRMRRRRTFAATWALAAVGLVTPAAATEYLTPEAEGTGVSAFASSIAADVPTIDALNEIGLDVSALTSLIAAFGLFGSNESPSGAGVSVSTVSAPVVVPADALWTFDAGEITVTSTITITEVAVGLRGHQAEINLCAGPVVSDYGAYGYGKVIGEHNHCGGAYVLDLEVGDVVRVTGYEAGNYVVAFLKDVPKKNTPVTVLGGADLFLQTCHFTGGQMRLVALTPQ